MIKSDFVVFPVVLLRDDELSVQAIRVLVALAGRMDTRTGDIRHFRQARIAEDAGVSQGCVSRTIARYMGYGYLAKVQDEYRFIGQMFEAMRMTVNGEFGE